MPIPSAGDLHVNRVLTDLSIKFMRDQSDLIGSLVFPVIGVAQKSNIFRTYDRADWFRETAERRAPGTPTVGGGWRLGQQTYNAEPWGIHVDISDQERGNADSIFDLDSDAMEYDTTQIMMRYEQLVLTNIFAASVWTGAATGNDQTGVAGAPGADQFLQFNDDASAPVELLDRLRTEVHEQTGKRPNTLVVGPRVHDELKEHPVIAEKIKYTQRAVVTEDLIAGILEIENYRVARYTRTTSAEQAAADTFAYQAGTGMWMGFVEPNPGIKKASAGYTFGWSGYTGVGGIEGLGTGARIKKFRIEANESDRIEALMAVDVNRVAAILGIRFATAVAS